ncbi:hypothetical protein [Microbacterium album]|uniref:Uncharacterized protein n=1 Tax=Microbacterium album TaxID=2053191 RepID=A0A917MNE8_9MICO|nr:hypothetical protein [Microbacterium album]GGH40925.1 hypothetical protein GCM10010921_13180 [Microbacterium album]
MPAPVDTEQEAEAEAPIDPARVRDLLESYFQQGLTDGLPVVPITASYVEEFLATVSRGPGDVLFEIPHLNRRLTVQLAAANAAMAGCLPEYFPVVVAAWEAVAQEPYPKAGIWQSTTGPAPLFIVNGPIRERLGINSAGNVFGSGIRPNATIGRAIRLGAINAFGLAPHKLDQATQATPAKFSACFGENEEASPWEPLHVEHGFAATQSTVAAATIRAVSHIEARHTVVPEQLARDLLTTITRSGALMHEFTNAIVVLSPEHAAVFADAGWSKADLRTHLFEGAVVSREELRSLGKEAVSRHTRWRLPADHPDAVPDRAAESGETRGVRVLERPESVQVVVAGANNAGVSAVADIFTSGSIDPEVPLSLSPVDDRAATTNQEGAR